MGKLWRSKIFQWTVRIFIIFSMVIVADKLHTFKYFIENGFMTVENISAESLVKDIKMMQVIGGIIWALAIVLYNNFTYEINRQNTKNSNEE